ncbi:hypothetical protein MMC28_001050 [Mycoblastus sanguinarius]|nr:hypothetical protein [Mycoblastus sanguinarius]
MSFAVVIEGMTLIAYVVILGGGKQKRETGWKILSGLHVLVGALECASMAIIVSVALAGAGRKDAAYLYDNDDRFFPGWKLDISWIVCTVSWSVMFLLAAGISATALLLPSEGGYELILGDDWGQEEQQSERTAS